MRINYEDLIGEMIDYIESVIISQKETAKERPKDAKEYNYKEIFPLYEGFHGFSVNIVLHGVEKQLSRDKLTNDVIVLRDNEEEGYINDFPKDYQAKIYTAFNKQIVLPMIKFAYSKDE